MARTFLPDDPRGTFNIACYTNQDYRVQLVIQDQGGTPYSFTGWTASMQIRDGVQGASALVSVSTTESGNGSVITFDANEAGLCEIFIAEADLAALTVPDGSERKTYKYDAVFTDGSGDQAPLIGGDFVLVEGVTE
jgi:hypothetical protein